MINIVNHVTVLCVFSGPADYDICNENNGPSHSFGMKLPEPVSVLQSKIFTLTKLYVWK